MVFGAAQLVIRNQILLQLPELLQDRLHHFSSRLRGRARVDGKAAGVAIGIELGEHRVGQTLPLADVLEEPRAHASAEQRVENVASEALLMRQWEGGDSETQLDLLERFLVAQSDPG